jgi:hypothetical protein
VRRRQSFRKGSTQPIENLWKHIVPQDCAEDIRQWIAAQKDPRTRFLNADSRLRWRIRYKGEEYEVLKETLESAGNWSIEAISSKGDIVKMDGRKLTDPTTDVTFIAPA